MEEIIKQLDQNVIDLGDEAEFARTIEGRENIEYAIHKLELARIGLAEAVAVENQEAWDMFVSAATQRNLKGTQVG